VCNLRMIKKSYLYWFIFIGILTCFYGCIKKSQEFDVESISKIKISNRATHYYGGNPESLIIDDTLDINYVKDKIESLSENIYQSVYINSHYGSILVERIDSIGKKEEFFAIIFTKSYGDIIRYGSKGYYRNTELTTYLKEKLGITKERLRR